jgi:hypothetical protein
MTINRARSLFTLVLFSIGFSRSAKQRDAEDVPATGESVFRFREDGNPITELAQVRELDELILVGDEESKKLTEPYERRLQTWQGPRWYSCVSASERVRKEFRS